MTKKNKTILIAAIVLAAGTAIAVTIAVSRHSKPDFAKMSPQQIRQYFDSNEFRDANEDKRRETFQQMGEMMMKRMTAQADEYAALKNEDEKTVYLDKIIDEMQARRAEFLARDANRPDANGPPDPNRFRRFGPPDANRPRFGMGGPNGWRPQVNPQRNREFSSMMSADTRVKMTQFGLDMMNRMQQRGIQPPMMGGPRGSFGGPPPGGPGSQR
jgi:hypothetical protein